MTHTCREDANPRHKGYCCKCGRAVPHTTNGNPSSGNDDPSGTRDHNQERSLTRTAGEQHGLQPAANALSDYADSRADQGPVHGILTRDFTREAREELADLRNYIVWRIQQLLLQGYNAQAVTHYVNALGHAVAAWHELKLAEDA